MEKNKMENPWKDLKQTNGEYIAEYDIECIKNTPALRGALVFNTLPWPYMGDPERATVYVLAKSTICDDAWGAEERDRQAIKNSLAHSFDGSLPLIALDPRFDDTSLQIWWLDKLQEVIDKTSLQDVGRYMFVAQYVPYSHHKGKLNKPRKMLPSQKYTVSLVRGAIKAKKNIVIMSPRPNWYQTIPELETYGKCYTLISPRSGVISERNVHGEENFRNIVEAINNARGNG